MDPDGDAHQPEQAEAREHGRPSPPPPAPGRPSRLEQLREWAQRPGPTPFVQPTDEVRLDIRKHPISLAAAGVRTLAGLVALLSGLAFLPVLAFAVATAAWARQRLRQGLKESLVAAGVAVLVLLVLANGSSSLGQRMLCFVALMLWAAEDVADWYEDRLVVTKKRLYRRYGVFTRHSPSLALTGITFVDASISPLGGLLHYGTLQFDSAAQADDPLARFDFIPNARQRHHEILKLRAEALPKFPKLES